MSESQITMNPNWTRRVYVDGIRSTWGTTPLATMAHQVHADLVAALGLAIPTDFGITTTAHHIGDGAGTMLVIRFRSSEQSVYMAKPELLKAIAEFVRERMGIRAKQNGIGGITYVGMIMFIKGVADVVTDFSHFA